jgi:protein involved in polysaccharide export with SLBB domain
MNNRFVPLFFVFILSLSLAVSQDIKQKAEAQLNTMTPEQIDAKIKEAGMTRAEAEAKAKEYGIDLDSYLMKVGTGPKVTTPAVNVEINQTPPPGTAATPNAAPGAPMPSTAAPAEEQVKIIPVKGKEPATGGVELFGYDLFKSSAGMFEARPSIDNDYRIGVGDVLKIALWGEMQSYNEYTVDGEGRILVSSVGPILVSGLTLERAKRNVQNAMSGAFGGLAKSPPTIFMDLTVARIRPVRIFMMGEVGNPGGYELSGFSNVFNSLFTIGGPKQSGSLRDIRVVRSGKTIANVDMYDYLIGSTKTSDIRVNDNDVIYVPLRGKTVTIRGEVSRSARFELLPNEQLKRLLEFSGGIRTTMYLERIQVDRIIPFAERTADGPDRKIFDIDFSVIVKTGKDYQLEDGDVITVFPILERKENFVTIDGAVYRPGTYQKDKIKTVKDLIMAADNLLPEVYTDRGEITRTYPDKRRVIIPFNVAQAAAGSPDQNIILMNEDVVRIYSKYDINPQQNISVEGFAKNPGSYRLAEGMRLYDLTPFIIGLTDTLYKKDVLMETADLIRLNQDGFTTRIVPFNLENLILNKSGDTLLLPGDRIVIYPRTAIEERERTVDVFGSVKKPGQYKLSANMTLVDLLLQAGGYTEDAFDVTAEVARVTRNGLGKDSLVQTIFASIPDYFDVDAVNPQQLAAMRLNSFPLKHRDQVFIRPNPAYVYQNYVTIAGEVQFPGKYALNVNNERISHLIKRAGGLKPNGYLRGGRLVRDGVTIRTNIELALMDDEGPEDIVLKPGDVVSIPRETGTVMVLGNVNNPGTYGHADNKSFSYYIDAAGDKLDSTDYAVVTYPEGMSSRVNFGWFRSNPEIPDGSTIIVYREKPPLPEPVTTDRQTTTYEFIKDMLAIVVSSVTIIVLASKL